MVKLTPQQVQTLNELNASYRFAHQAQTYKDNPTGGPALIDKPGRIQCEIFDRTTGTFYFTAEGLDEREALDKAITGAIEADKPLTPAQRAGRMGHTISTLKTQVNNLTTQLGKVDEIAAENVKLKQEIEAVKRAANGDLERIRAEKAELERMLAEVTEPKN